MTDPETPSASSKYGEAFRQNGTLMVRWSMDTRHLLVMEFITEARLYPQLNDFLRKRLR